MWVDYEGLEGLSGALGIDDVDGGIYDESGDRRVETLVHEIAHALSLGVPMVRGVSYEVTRCINLLSSEAALRNEALALASEMFTLLAIGIECDRRALAAAAKKQGVPSRLFRSLWRSKEALDLGQRVTRFIGRRLSARRSHRLPFRC